VLPWLPSHLAGVVGRVDAADQSAAPSAVKLLAHTRLAGDVADLLGVGGFHRELAFAVAAEGE
jgi:hypothetical protein